MRRCHGWHYRQAEAGAYKLEDTGELVCLEYAVEFCSSSGTRPKNVVAKAVAFFEKKKSLVLERLQINRLFARQRMLLCHCEKKRLPRQFAAYNVGVPDRQARNRQINIAGLQLLNQMQRGVFSKLKINIRKAS